MTCSGLDAPRMTVEVLGFFATHHCECEGAHARVEFYGALIPCFLSHSSLLSFALTDHLHPSFYVTYTALMYGHRYIST